MKNLILVFLFSFIAFECYSQSISDIREFEDHILNIMVTNSCRIENRSVLYSDDEDFSCSKAESITIGTTKGEINPSILLKYENIKYLQVFGGIETSHLLSMKDSLRVLNVTSKFIDDTSVNFNKLLLFDNVSGKQKNVSQFFERTPNLLILNTSICRLRSKDIYRFPSTLKCLRIYVNKRIKGKKIPVELFTLRNLEELFISIGTNKNKELLIGNLNKIKLPIAPNLEKLSLPIDIGKKENVEQVKLLKNLKELTVETYTSSNYDLLRELSWIEKIVIEKGRNRKKEIEGNLPTNVKWHPLAEVFH